MGCNCRKKAEQFKAQLSQKIELSSIQTIPQNMQRLLNADYNTLTEREKRIRIRYKRQHKIR